MWLYISFFWGASVFFPIVIIQIYTSIHFGFSFVLQKQFDLLCVCVHVSCLVVSNSLQPHRLQPHQAPLSMGFSRQEHWSRLPFPSPKGTIERRKVKSLSRVQLFTTPWIVAYQAPPSMEFSRQEYWNGLPFPSPGWLAVVLHIYFSLVACAFGVHSKKLIAKTKVKEVFRFVFC